MLCIFLLKSISLLFDSSLSLSDILLVTFIICLILFESIKHLVHLLMCFFLYPFKNFYHYYYYYIILCLQLSLFHCSQDQFWRNQECEGYLVAFSHISIVFSLWVEDKLLWRKYHYCGGIFNQILSPCEVSLGLVMF